MKAALGGKKRLAGLARPDDKDGVHDANEAEKKRESDGKGDEQGGGKGAGG